MKMITVDFKIDNKVVATFTMNPDDIVNATKSNVEKNTYKAPTESGQENSEIETIDWHKVKEFIEKNNIPLNDIESGVLESYITNGTLSEKQKRVLPHVLKRAQTRGFKPSYPF